MRYVRYVRGMRRERDMRPVRPDHSQGRGLMLESEHYGNWILEVWLEASRSVYCSLSAEI